MAEKFKIFFAVVGVVATVIVLATILTSGHAQVEPRAQAPEMPPYRLEVKVPRLNWQAADKALASNLDSWNSAMQLRPDMGRVWTLSTPIHGHQLPSMNQRVWRPSPQPVYIDSCGYP